MSADVVDGGRGGHQDDEQGVGPAVEGVAEQGEQQVSGSSWGGVVEQQCQGQKVEDKEVRTEDHGDEPERRVT